MDGVRGELATLAASEQMYDVSSEGTSVGNSSGNIAYDNASGNVVISIFSNSNNFLATFAHEAKHAYQYEKGALSLNYLGNGGGSLYDITDEIEAYKRGQFFGANESAIINENWVRTQGYSGLKSGPIGINTLTGNPLNPTETNMQSINRNSNKYKSMGRNPLEVIKR